MWLAHLLHYLKHLCLEYSLVLVLLMALLSHILLGLYEGCHELIELVLKRILRSATLWWGHTVSSSMSACHCPVKHLRISSYVLQANNQ